MPSLGRVAARRSAAARLLIAGGWFAVFNDFLHAFEPKLRSCTRAEAEGYGEVAASTNTPGEGCPLFGLALWAPYVRLGSKADARVAPIKTCGTPAGGI